MNKFLLLALTFFITGVSTAQIFSKRTEFTKKDTIRGTLMANRSCYDVHFYDLNITVDPDSQFVTGYNDIYFKATQNFEEMQVDLFDFWKIDKIEWFEPNMAYAGPPVRDVAYERLYHSMFLKMPVPIKEGELHRVRITYHGVPMVAKRAPWDGGFVWSEDKNGNHHVGVACQGLGASSWWPNKDHLSDEPDSMYFSVACPANLKFVGNGNLMSDEADDSYKPNYHRYNWRVSYPINNYNVSVNIADYKQWSEVYTSPVDGRKLDMDYYVLPENFEKSKEHFKQVKPMMECFENLYGPYPFWNDGYALVETPYLGMEHQGAIAYGNRYLPGYLGQKTAGQEFDYIIIHETGHEWWGNSISVADVAELWIHESFCTYSEAQYVECLYGNDAYMDYLNAKVRGIANKKPIVGPFGVNQEGADIYNKGAWVLHTTRGIVDNDELWHDIVYSFATDYQRSIVNTQTFIDLVKAKSGKDISIVYDQYLNHANPPILEYKLTKVKKGYNFEYRWQTDVEGFEMPVKFEVGKKSPGLKTISANNNWQTFFVKKGKIEDFILNDEYFYFVGDQK